MRGNRLAIDIGGTFTDLVLEVSGRTFSSKVLTTHNAPHEAVLHGTKAILRQADIAPSSLDLVIHGTTLATNALIERKGAATALVTTAGFRDSLEMAYEHRFAQYDLYMERPDPLIPRDLRFEVTERLAADGSVLLPIDESTVEQVAAALKERCMESVAICLLHSYANSAHELRVRELLRHLLPNLAITLSSEVCPEIREYERTSTTVANAYILPLMDHYLAKMEEGLKNLGIECPLFLMMSSGGMATVETARQYPVRMVESGPAGGVILARTIAARYDYDRAISFDMGGTTAKLTLIDNFTPQQSRHFEVDRAYRFAKGSGLPIRIPVIDMVEIGAGGGSIARVDKLKRIMVGPDSAGSEPGPVCYGRGGKEPTVTDADLVLGRIDPTKFAGGKVTLKKDLAVEAIGYSISRSLAASVEEAALGISEIVDEAMASAARIHAVESGKHTTNRVLIAFGGSAPLHAARLAQKLGVHRIVIPQGAGVGSALGFLNAPVAYDVVRTKLVSIETANANMMGALFYDMRREAEEVVQRADTGRGFQEKRSAFMRYRGQGHEVEVVLPPDDCIFEHSATLRTLFEAAYEGLFGRTIPDLQVEALTWTLSLSEPARAIEREIETQKSLCATPHGTRSIVNPDDGSIIDAAIYFRTNLHSGEWFAGPALIVEDDTSIVVPAGFTALQTAAGDILIDGVGK